MNQTNKNTENKEISVVKELCQTFKISQAALSRRFGIPIRTVEDWCAGRRNPPDYVICMMRELLDEKNKN